MSCALGIRSQVTRSRLRNEVLANHAIDFSDAEEVIAPISSMSSRRCSARLRDRQVAARLVDIHRFEHRSTTVIQAI